MTKPRLRLKLEPVDHMWEDQREYLDELRRISVATGLIVEVEIEGRTWVCSPDGTPEVDLSEMP